MRVIFLDIDGVMNSQLFYEKRHKKRFFTLSFYYYWLKGKIKWIFNGFKHKGVSLKDYKTPKNHKTFKYRFNRLKEETDPQKWEWLIELCKETDSKICVSSVWKHHFDALDKWGDALTLLGFPPHTFIGITGARRTLRGTEIKEWMEVYNENTFSVYGGAGGIIDQYAIIDDDSDMLEEQMANFFHTDGYCGLTPNTCYRINRHFTL